jgi:hypothetical protein
MTETADEPVHPLGPEQVLRGWCQEQLAPWQASRLPYGTVLTEFHRLNATEPNVFVLRIARRGVTLIEKPPSGRHGLYEMSLARAVGYRDFLARAVQHGGLDLAAELAVFVGDGALAAPRVPVFAFQKPDGNRSVLLPDPDLLGGSCYADSEPRDSTAYAAKRPGAVFVGATSGGQLTAETVRSLALPRLRAAWFFRGHPDVVFRLPRLVQCDSAETEALLRAMGFGDRVTMPWADQLGYRFLLSMDGNGASCSRVARALASNAVLLKYDSPHKLYYFSGLRPWLHYVPINEDRDVIRVLETERRTPGFFSRVASEGRRFAEAFLTHESVLGYTAELLSLYGDWLEVPAGNEAVSQPCVAISVHVRNIGDLPADVDGWAGARGSGLWIEGVQAVVTGTADPVALEYRACLNDGSLSPWTLDGTFCGTRGQTEPLRGFAMRLSAGSAGAWRCVYSVRFIDGSVIGPLADGELCRSPQDTPLEAISVALTPRHPAPAQPA